MALANLKYEWCTSKPHLNRLPDATACLMARAPLLLWAASLSFFFSCAHCLCDARACFSRQCYKRMLGQAVFYTNAWTGSVLYKHTFGQAVFQTNAWTGSVLYKRLDRQCFIQTFGQAVFYINAWTGSVLYKRLDRQRSIQTLGHAVLHRNAWTRRAS